MARKVVSNAARSVARSTYFVFRYRSRGRATLPEATFLTEDEARVYVNMNPGTHVFQWR